jgi:hypothetical protein
MAQRMDGKDKNKNFQLKSTKRQAKLRSACNIYDRYLNLLDEQQLFDYDDTDLEGYTCLHDISRTEIQSTRKVPVYYD